MAKLNNTFISVVQKKSVKNNKPDVAAINLFPTNRCTAGFKKPNAIVLFFWILSISFPDAVTGRSKSVVIHLNYL